MEVALITTGTGGALALLGGWLGILWGKSTEHQQWLRNEQIRRYSAYLHQLTQISLQMSDLMDSRGTKGWEEAQSRFKDHLLVASDPSFRLVAPLRVVACAEALQKSLLEKADLLSMEAGDERKEALDANSNMYDHLEEQLINAARASFGAKEELNFFPRPLSTRR